MCDYSRKLQQGDSSLTDDIEVIGIQNVGTNCRGNRWNMERLRKGQACTMYVQHRNPVRQLFGSVVDAAK